MQAEQDGGPDSGPSEPCESPGAVEDVACGSCGTTSRSCTSAGVWSYGECMGEGECAAGSMRSGACGHCGTQVERCTAECTWAPEGSCMDEGVCAPGTRTRTGDGCPAGETREALCSDACVLEPTGACDADACATPGTSERAPCGNCGTRERTCTAEHVWSYGPCEDEGECAPGSTESVPCGMCGTQTASCTAACAWETTGACGGEGECAPGSMSRTSEGCPAGQSRALTCNGTCTYDPGACEIDECTPGATMTATCGMCGTRVRTCSASRTWVEGPCTGEGVCMPGETGTQSCGYCGSQPTVCDTSCTWAPAAACTGESACAAGTYSPCTTFCGSTGTAICGASCSPGFCLPTAELCDGLDDDCDGEYDEACVACAACGGSTPVTGTGGRYSIPLSPHVRTGSCGGAGSEGLLSLTLPESSDVFISTHGASVDTVVYVRSCTCAGPEVTDGCKDDADGRVSSALHLAALPAGNYAIVVDTKVPMSGVIPVDVYVTPASSPGDRCGNPRPFASGATRAMGNTCALSSDYDIADDSGACTAAPGGDGPDAVYYFYVPTTRVVTFSGCSAGNDYDGTVYIRSVCNGPSLAQQIGCSDDGCPSGAGTCDGYGPSATARLTPGLYYLFVDGSASGASPTCSSCGDYDLAISGL